MPPNYGSCFSADPYPLPYQRLEHLPPIGRLAGCDESRTDLLGLRMQTRVLDAEFAHQATASLGAIELFGQAEVFGNHLPLLV